MDPAKPGEARITVLAPPSQPGEMLANVTVQSSAAAFPALKLDANRAAA